MKKQDLDALAGLYEGLYSPVESGQYLSEDIKSFADRGGAFGALGRAISRSGTDAGKAQNRAAVSRFNQGVASFMNRGGVLGRGGAVDRLTNKPATSSSAKPTNAPYQSKFAGARDAAVAKAKQIQGSPVVGPRPTEKPAGTTPAAARPATPGAGAPATAKVAPTAAAKPAGQTGDKAKDMATWAKANPTLANKPKSPNPLMQKTFGYQTGNAPDQVKKKALTSGYEWNSAKKMRDIADAYSSIYEAKKKDQDQDGDNDFADVRIARMIASGMSKAEAIAAVKNKEYNEEYELDEATRMRKELGKEGETATRKELASRSRAHKRSGSVDKTIAAAERAADWSGDEKKVRTLRRLAASRRGSVRGEGGLRGYAAKVEGSDRDLQFARGSARSAGTLTPKEKKQLGEEYQIYEIVSSYLLENNFAETIDDANVIIENMSEVWVAEILENLD